MKKNYSTVELGNDGGDFLLNISNTNEHKFCLLNNPNRQKSTRHSYIGNRKINDFGKCNGYRSYEKYEKA